RPRRQAARPAGRDRRRDPAPRARQRAPPARDRCPPHRRRRDRRPCPRRARHGLPGRGRAARGGAVIVTRGLARAARVGGGAALAALACALVGAGGADGASLVDARASLSGGLGGGPALGLRPLAATLLVVFVCALVIASVARRLAFDPPSARAQRVSFWLHVAPDLIDIGVSLALVAGVFPLLAATGGLASPLSPLLYGVVAFAITVLSRPGAIAAIGASVLLEVALAARAGGRPEIALAATHV